MLTIYDVFFAEGVAFWRSRTRNDCTSVNNFSGVIFGSRPVTIIFVVSVCLFVVCLCRVFLSRL